MTESKRLVFVCPRFASGNTLGGAETLMKALASRAINAGHTASFLTTCANNHFSWKNEIPAGTKTIDNIDVHFFPVDKRDTQAFLRVQGSISNGRQVSEAQQDVWFTNSVNSRALISYLTEHLSDFDKIIVGPYLFGLIRAVSEVCPEKTLLLPCLHDESFAYLSRVAEMFQRVGGVIFNSVPEKNLAEKLYSLGTTPTSVVGMGMEPFEADPDVFKRTHGLSAPYILYSGRREPLKGTPLLLDYLTAFRSRTGHDVKIVLTGSGEIAVPPALAPHLIDVGFVSEQEKRNAMAGALVFCHPSLNESLGIVILESWLARTPVLVP